ncbi:MAG: ATP-binding protein [Gemmatimonadaceae bacterium]
MANRPAGTAETDNPFRIGGVVAAPYFTDREEERKRIRRSLTTPQDNLLVYGPRRMGKTSLLRLVQEELRQDGQPIIMADLSTATSLTEMTTRLLQAAARELGRRWRDAATDLVRRMQVKVTLEPDPATGMLLPSLGMGLANADMTTQRSTFAGALDAIEAMAVEKDQHLGIILDEFQEIHRFGGETAEAHLRGIIQHHQHLSYVLAGSDQRLIQAMIGKSRPFYKLLAHLPVGPIDPGHFAAWIETRLASVHIKADGIGELLVRVAGPRTRDIVQLGHELVEISRTKGEATLEDVADAFTQIVRNADAPYRALWTGLSRLQQQVLRALAVRATGLTTAATSREFALTAASGSLTRTAQALVAQDILVAVDGAYLFDDPFMRGWVILSTLPDLGRTLSVLHMPIPEYPPLA